MFHRIGPTENYLKNHSIVIHDEVSGTPDSLLTFNQKLSYGLGLSQRPQNFTISDEALIGLSKLKPNRRILWARFNLGIYTLVPKRRLAYSEERAAIRCYEKNLRRAAKKRKPKEGCKGFWMWMAYTVGEPPAQLDSLKLKKAEQQMSVYLAKNGYFDNHVKAEVLYKRKGLIFWRKGKKCRVQYHIYPGDPYRLRNIVPQIEDKAIAGIYPQISAQSILKPGMTFNLDVLDQERDRIASILNNRGYYEFTKDYIVFDADSTVGNHEVDLKLLLTSPRGPSPLHPDSSMQVPHKKFFMGKIFVHTDFDLGNPFDERADTLYHDGVYIIYHDKPSISKELISCTQVIQSNELYQKDKIERTYKRYSQLGVMRATSIVLSPLATLDSSGVYLLETHIRLTPGERQGYNFNPKITHRDGNFGLYGSLSYRHRNLFRGAEALEVQAIGGLEAAQTLTQVPDPNNPQNQNIRRAFALNTYEVGPEVTYKVPRLWPLGCDRTRKSSEPFSSITAGLNYQNRPEYLRTLSTLRFGWNAIANPDQVSRWSVDWAELSLIKIQKEQIFIDFLQDQNDSLLKNSYQDHLILSFLNASYSVNTQKKTFQRAFFYWKIAGGFAGVGARTVMSVFGAERDSLDAFHIAGLRYAHYGRIENEFKWFINVNDKNTFAFRLFQGLGVPLANNPALPFEKSFFSGGSNGIRAWQARTLGPGSWRSDQSLKTYNNIGELKLEGNFEYRFKMTNMLNWALFYDAGNIWLLRPNAAKPGADFSGERFLSEVAMGGGIGLRLNFDFFLVRFDFGLQLKDPSKVIGERWLWQPKTEYLQHVQENIDATIQNVPLRSITMFNLGIGFPF
jgi:Omp85 superfamily domain